MPNYAYFIKLETHPAGEDITITDTDKHEVEFGIYRYDLDENQTRADGIKLPKEQIKNYIKIENEITFTDTSHAVASFNDDTLKMEFKYSDGVTFLSRTRVRFRLFNIYELFLGEFDFYINKENKTPIQLAPINNIVIESLENSIKLVPINLLDNKKLRDYNNNFTINTRVSDNVDLPTPLPNDYNSQKIEVKLITTSDGDVLCEVHTLEARRSKFEVTVFLTHNKFFDVVHSLKFEVDTTKLISSKKWVEKYDNVIMVKDIATDTIKQYKISLDRTRDNIIILS